MPGGADFLVSMTIRAVDQASSVLGKIRGEAEQADNVITRNAAGIRTAGVAMAAGGVAIVGGLAAMASKAAEAGGALVDMSARTGASIETLSSLGYAAQQTGASMSDVETGLKFIAKNAEGAGMAMTNADGSVKTTGELFMEAGERIRNAGEGAERTQVALELFGKSGTQLIPMFTDAGKTVADFAAEAERLGIVMSTDAANAADDMGDKMDGLKATMGALGNQVGVAVIPVFIKLLETVQPIVTDIAKWIEAHPKLAAGLGMGALAVGGFMTTVGPLLIALPSLVSGFGLISGWLGAGGIATAAASATTALAGVGPGLVAAGAAAGPIALVALAIAGLAYELYKLKQAYDEAAAAGKQANETFQGAQGQADAEAAKHGTQEQLAAQRKEQDNAPVTVSDRFWGAVTGGGRTSKDIARERVAMGQSASKYGGARAGGGPVSAGLGYIVGEKEAEWFEPTTGGAIMTAAQMVAVFREKLREVQEMGFSGKTALSAARFNTNVEDQFKFIKGMGIDGKTAWDSAIANAKTLDNERGGGGGGAVIHQVFNFNGPTYGAEGIKQIAEEVFAQAARAAAYGGRSVAMA